MKFSAVLLDMGGVILSVPGGGGLPDGRMDWRGREALLHFIRDKGGHAGRDDLERLVFTPWRREYDRRYELGREANWNPHLVRLRKKAGIRTHSATLLAVWFRPYAESLTAVPGAREVLAALCAKGLKLALISNVPMPGKLYLQVLKNHRLASYFDLTLFSYDTGRRKPSPMMLRMALERLATDPSHAVMVGDRRGADIAAGLAAGTRTVWVRRNDDDGPAPDAEIDSIAELPAVLERLT